MDEPAPLETGPQPAPATAGPVDAGQPGETGAAAQRTRRFTRKRVLWGLLAAASAYLLYEFATWPDVAALAKKNPDTTAFIETYKAEQEAAGKKAAPAWRWVPASRIAPATKRAVVCGEDLEFFSHDGFSAHEMKEALKDTFEDGKKLRGASTITQQLAKNLWLSPSRNPLRKIEEALLTRQLEKNLSKKRILELYLNVVEFGPGIYGVDAAARHYFGVSAEGLSEEQAAALAAGLPSPKRWNPGAKNKTAEKRTRMILSRMAQAGWLRQLV